jgi:uncharacterized protein
VQLAIISDTHMPRGQRRLPDACLTRLAAADAIVHAGDLCTLEVLAQLRELGPPVTAVAGNVDEPAVAAVLPQTARLRFGDATIAIVHDAGPRAGRSARMARRFPDADAVIFGHSHLPLIADASDPGRPTLVNPGSPTERRRSPHHTMALATVPAGGGPVSFALIELD